MISHLIICYFAPIELKIDRDIILNTNIIYSTEQPNPRNSADKFLCYECSGDEASAKKVPPFI